MSDNTVVGLNIGSQSVSLGVFENTKSGLVLKKFASSSILADPANDAFRNAQVNAALEALSAEVGLKKAQVHYAVSGESAFTRFVKLPAIGGDNLDQIVSFEAQQNIPFPLDEVAWDWANMEYPSATEKEVAIVAIKKDFLNEINGAVSNAGLVAKDVESSPVSIANSFFYSYPEIQESALIVDLGAKSTNLIYVEGKRIFIRSVKVGGSSITNAICKEYGIEYEEAERIKIESGRILLNNSYLAEWDQATGNLAAVITNAVSRLPSEIARTTNFFRSQHAGSAPTRVYLSGAGCSLPYFREYFEDKLRLPVEYFNPFKNVKMGAGVDSVAIQSNAHTLGEIVGLALKGDSRNAIKIQLIPDAVAESIESGKKKPYYIAAAAALVVGAAVWAGSQFFSASEASKKVDLVSAKVQSLKPFQQKLNALGKKQSALDEFTQDFYESVSGRTRELKRIENLKEVFSSQFVWLTGYETLLDYDFQSDPAAYSYVSNEFTSLPYGVSALKTIEIKGKGAQQTQPSFNAVKLTGLWRKNPSGQNIVYKMIEELRNDSNSYFTFNIEGKDLEDKDVLSIESTIPSDELTAPFTIILPLKETTPLSQ